MKNSSFNKISSLSAINGLFPLAQISRSYNTNVNTPSKIVFIPPLNLFRGNGLFTLAQISRISRFTPTETPKIVYLSPLNLFRGSMDYSHWPKYQEYPQIPRISELTPMETPKIPHLQVGQPLGSY